MLKMIGVSFMLALQNIRANFLHTILSVLGIVIGVAALVAILSFIDGIEKFAKEQISNTSNLQSMIIETSQHKMVDGISVQKQEPPYFNYEKMKSLEESLSLPAKGFMMIGRPQEMKVPDSAKTVGVAVIGVVPEIKSDVVLVEGRLFSEQELLQQKPVTVVSEKLAKIVSGEQTPKAAIGRKVKLMDKEFTVVGIVKNEANNLAHAAVPITLFDEEALKATPPVVIFVAGDIEHMEILKAEIELWLKEHLAKEEDDFKVITNEARLEQIGRAFTVFKLVMGFITGIAVLVGGIGIMNVLLISVTERTTEIGIRKATGAKKRDIVLQFLSESVTVSSFGSLLGLVLGILGTMIAVPIVQHFSKAPFEAAFTLSTMLIVAVLAIILGVVFGTYPAMRAAGLDPVEAIRRE